PAPYHQSQLSFICRDTAEKERQNRVTYGSRSTGVRLPGWSGKGTPVRAGGAVEGGEGEPGRRGPEERRRVLGPAVDAVAEVHDARPVAGAGASRLAEDRPPADGPAGHHPDPPEV